MNEKDTQRRGLLKYAWGFVLTALVVLYGVGGAQFESIGDKCLGLVELPLTTELDYQAQSPLGGFKELNLRKMVGTIVLVHNGFPFRQDVVLERRNDFNIEHVLAGRWDRNEVFLNGRAGRGAWEPDLRIESLRLPGKDTCGFLMVSDNPTMSMTLVEKTTIRACGRPIGKAIVLAPAECAVFVGIVFGVGVIAFFCLSYIRSVFTKKCEPA